MKATCVLFQVLFWVRLFFFSSQVGSVSAKFGNTNRNKSDSFFLTPPNSTSAFRDEDVFYRGYISSDLLREFSELLKPQHIAPTYSTGGTGYTLSKEIDVVFRIFMDINSSEYFLQNSDGNGGIANHHIIFMENVVVNQPFVVQPPTTLSSIQRFLENLSNRTRNFYNEWIGGSVTYLALPKVILTFLNSRCSGMDICFPVGRREKLSWKIFSTHDGFSIFIFPAEQASPL